MNKQEIIELLKSKGYTSKQIIEKRGGIEIVAEKRVPIYEFDSRDFFVMFEGKVDMKKIHMLDPWTVTIECE